MYQFYLQYKNYIQTIYNQNTKMNQEKNSEELVKFILKVPKHLRKYVKYGIFIIPAQQIIDGYQEKKKGYLKQIQKTKQASENSMHKYTSLQPIISDDVEKINRICSDPLSEYCQKYLKQYKFDKANPEYHGGFAITYNQGHKGLALHKDDSIYTVNLCIDNQSQGNQVVFLDAIKVQMLEDYACIHPGPIPHQTQQLKSGVRTNIVLWFK